MTGDSTRAPAEAGKWENRLRRASWWLLIIGTVSALLAIPLGYFRMSLAGSACLFASMGSTATWSRLSRKRWEAREKYSDQRLAEAFAKLRAQVAAHGHELPEDATDGDLKWALFYVMSGCPLYIDGEVACSCEALAIVAPAAVKAREIALRSGKPPRRAKHLREVIE